MCVLYAFVLIRINEKKRGGKKHTYQRQHKNSEIHRYLAGGGGDGGSVAVAIATAIVRAFTTCRRCYTLVASNSLRSQNVAVFSLYTNSFSLSLSLTFYI